MRGTKQITIFIIIIIIIIILLRSTIESDRGEKKVYGEFESQANMHPKSAINLPPPTIKHSNKGNQPTLITPTKKRNKNVSFK